MTPSFDPRTRRGARAAFAKSLRCAATLGVAVAAFTTGCKGNEVAKAPEAAPPIDAPEAPVEAVAGSSPTVAPVPASGSEASPPSIHTLTMKRLDGTDATFSTWAGQVLLVVNTASKCGYTPQYEGLQQLHAKYAPRGFAVLGFPSNDFGDQEPGTSEQIAQFCTSIYAVNFPMFEKTKTIGQDKSALYALLSEAHGPPKWNFHKYLVDKHGKPVKAWPSAVEPSSPEIASAIEAQLAAQ
jgi:glutathione peroxidase